MHFIIEQKEHFDKVWTKHQKKEFDTESIKKNMTDNEWFRSRPEAVQKAILDYPNWCFYTYKGSKKPVRVYGVMEMENNEIRLHAVSAQIMPPNNGVIGGVSPNDIEKVDAYGEESLPYLYWQPIPEAFLEPIGFIYFIDKK